MKNTKLPDMCFVEHMGKAVIVKNGESGYYPLDFDLPVEHIDEHNENLGVTKAQAKAMKIGSLFGWDVPGADPDHRMNRLDG